MTRYDKQVGINTVWVSLFLPVSSLESDHVSVAPVRVVFLTRRVRKVVSGQWAVVSGQWAVGSGQWAVVSGQWVVGSQLSGQQHDLAARSSVRKDSSQMSKPTALSDWGCGLMPQGYFIPATVLPFAAISCMQFFVGTICTENNFSLSFHSILSVTHIHTLVISTTFDLNTLNCGSFES